MKQVTWADYIKEQTATIIDHFMDGTYPLPEDQDDEDWFSWNSKTDINIYLDDARNIRLTAYYVDDKGNTDTNIVIQII